FVAVRFSGQSLNAATAAARSSIVVTVAAVRRADCAASANEPASASGGPTIAGVERGSVGVGAGRGDSALAVGADAIAAAVSVTAGRASRFTGSVPIASSAPIAICQRSNASASAGPRGGGDELSGIGIAGIYHGSREAAAGIGASRFRRD